MDFRHVSPNSINYIKSASIAVQAKLYIKISKLHRVACQNVWFNQQCKYHHVIPNYINIRANTHSRAANVAIEKAQRVWLGEEARRWFTIRDNLKLHLKILHSELSFHLHNIEFDLLDQKARELSYRIGYEKYLTQQRKLNELIQKSRHNNTYNNNQNNCTHTFYPRVKNLSNIQLTSNEMTLLEKGLKYNLHKNIDKKSLETLAVDTEIAIFRNKKDDIVKSLAANQLKKYKGSERYNAEYKIFKSIQNKIEINDLVVNKADKGNTVVIMNKSEYNSKINDVILTDEFERLSSDPTKRFQAELKLCIKDAKQLFPPNSYHGKNLVMMNPQCPLLYGLPKIHKEQIPIRPVVSYVHAPTYKLAKYLNTIIKDKSRFKPKYTIKNSIELIDQIRDVHLPFNAKLVSLDVESLFTKVPYKECLGFLKNMFRTQNIHPGQTNDILRLTELCMKQNYFQFNNEHYIQKEGLAMGSPLSPLMADIFMDDYERKYVVQESKLLYYYRYVDDILLVWTGTTRQLHQFVNRLNTLHPKIKFKLEEEENNMINFLDLTIRREGNRHKFEVYRKPTCTDITIPVSSCHPWQHKLAAFHSLIHRLFKVPLSDESYRKELNIIYYIAQSNGYNKELIDKLIKRKENNIVKQSLYPSSKELTKFTCTLTYFGDLTDRLAKILRVHDIHCAYRPNSTLKTLCNGKDKLNTSKKSGVYRLKCDTCHNVYIGQTGRNFETRYKEHLAAYTNNYPHKSNFAKHLIDSNHSINNNNTFEPLHICSKDFRLCVLEQLEILKCSKHALLNEQTNFNTSPLLKLFACQ